MKYLYLIIFFVSINLFSFPQSDTTSQVLVVLHLLQDIPILHCLLIGFLILLLPRAELSSPCYSDCKILQSLNPHTKT